MTLKYENLLEFRAILMKEGYTTQIPETVFFNKIMQTFGISDYVIKNIAKAMHKTSLMRPLHNGFWEFLEVKND